MTLSRLSDATIGMVPAELRPRTDRGAIAPGIVHLGIGAFHRAHQAVYVEDAAAAAGGDWGIVGVTQRSRTVVDQLLPQDGLYSVLSSSPTGSDLRVIGVIGEVLCGPTQSAEVLDRLAHPRIRIVTLTVTEKGYRLDPATGRLLLKDVGIAADLAGGPPATTVGTLVVGLRRRQQRDAGPLTVLSCDNLPDNGGTLRSLVAEFCRNSVLDADGNLADWIDRNVSFPSSVVDRIVPATTDDDRRSAAGRLGVADHGLVVTEPYRQWVIAGEFPAGRPEWDTVGVVHTADIAPYEALKLRALNGPHSALAYLGALAGYRTIADAMGDVSMANYAWRLLTDDILPTLVPPDGVDLYAYARSVLDRFANPALRHRCVQIAMDGTQKLPQRLVATLAERLGAGGQPVSVAMALAGWMRYVWCAVRDSSGTGNTIGLRATDLSDPLAGRLADLIAGLERPSQVVRALLGITEVFGDLGDATAATQLLTECLERLVLDGVAGALADLE